MTTWGIGGTENLEANIKCEKQNVTSLNRYVGLFAYIFHTKTHTTQHPFEHTHWISMGSRINLVHFVATIQGFAFLTF